MSTDDPDLLDIDRSVPPGYERLHYTVRIAGDGTPEQFVNPRLFRRRERENP